MPASLETGHSNQRLLAEKRLIQNSGKMLSGDNLSFGAQLQMRTDTIDGGRGESGGEGVPYKLESISRQTSDQMTINPLYGSTENVLGAGFTKSNSASPSSMAMDPLVGMDLTDNMVTNPVYGEHTPRQQPKAGAVNYDPNRTTGVRAEAVERPVSPLEQSLVCNPLYSEHRIVQQPNAMGVSSRVPGPEGVDIQLDSALQNTAEPDKQDTSKGPGVGMTSTVTDNSLSQSTEQGLAVNHGAKLSEDIAGKRSATASPSKAPPTQAATDHLSPTKQPHSSQGSVLSVTLTVIARWTRRKRRQLRRLRRMSRWAVSPHPLQFHLGNTAMPVMMKEGVLRWGKEREGVLRWGKEREGVLRWGKEREGVLRWGKEREGVLRWGKEREGVLRWGKEREGVLRWGKEREGVLRWGKEREGVLRWGKEREGVLRWGKEREGVLRWGKEREGVLRWGKEREGVLRWGKEREGVLRWGKEREGVLRWGKEREGVLRWGKEREGVLRWGKEREGVLRWGKEREGVLRWGKEREGVLRWGKEREGVLRWGEEREGVLRWGEEREGVLRWGKEREGVLRWGEGEGGSTEVGGEGGMIGKGKAASLNKSDIVPPQETVLPQHSQTTGEETSNS